MSLPQVDPERRYLGGVLVAAGLLVAGLCGACTAALVVTTLFSTVVSLINHASALDTALGGAFLALLLFAFVGGLPTLFGVILLIKGRQMMQPKRRIGRDAIAAFSDPEPPV